MATPRRPPTFITCENPTCRKRAQRRRSWQRYCRSACRQAHVRARKGTAVAPYVSLDEVTDLDEELHRKVRSLIRELMTMQEHGCPVKGLGRLETLTDQVLRAAAHRERAKGRSWDSIGAEMLLSKTTLRFRYETEEGTKRV